MMDWLGRQVWWQRATRREQVLLALGALVVAAVVGWVGLWEPATRELARMEAGAARERALLAQARARTGEISAIALAPRRLPADLRASVESALAQRGLAVAVGGVELREGRVRVVLADARFGELIAALGVLEREAGLRVAEATLAARVEPGTVRAELTLTR